MLTVLNGMAGHDFATSLDRQVAAGLTHLDLKDAILGHRVEDLDRTLALAARMLIQERGLKVHCLSSSLGNDDIELGETDWLSRQSAILDRLLSVGDVLETSVVRVIVPLSTRTDASETEIASILARHPWLVGAFRSIVARIVAAGFVAGIENEAEACIVRSPADALTFLDALDAGDEVRFIWDVQNMWQMGHRPSVRSLTDLRHRLCSLHLKGGIADLDGRLVYAGPLRTASWPVPEILALLADDISIRSICLNPSHGRRPPGFDVWATALDDLSYVRSLCGSAPK
jgi:hypothetical protein